MTVDLSVDFCGIKLENPFVLAPSPSTDHLELIVEAFEAGWAGAVLKTTSLESGRVSHVYPLVTRIQQEDGLFIGLQNIDLVSKDPLEMIEQRIKILKTRFPSKIVIASIIANKKEDWQLLTKRLVGAGADIIECSISFSHGAEWDLCTKVQEPVETEQIAYWVKEVAGSVPVVIKLSSQDAELLASAMAVKRSSAEGVCVVNTIKSITGVDLDTFIPYPNIAGLSTFGGLSGPALKPIALRCTAEIARRVDIDIAATGGIATWQDSAEFILLGAKILQVCTAVLRYGTGIIQELTQGLQGWMMEKGFQSIQEVLGRSLPNLVEHSQLPRGIQMVSSIRTEHCNGCGTCYTACRMGGHQAIVFRKGEIPYVLKSECVGCGLCRAMCSSQAISLVRPSRDSNLYPAKIPVDPIPVTS